MSWFNKNAKAKKNSKQTAKKTKAAKPTADQKQAAQLDRAAKRLIDRLHIPLVVPDAAVDLFKEAIAQPDAVTALVPAKDIADDAGGCDKYLAIAVSGKTLIENGFEIDRSHHSDYTDREAAGQLAAALESSQVESVTFAEDRAGGYVVMLPNAKTLDALSTIDAIGGHNGDVNMFMWVLFPANIDEAADESDLQSEGTRVMVSFNTLYAASKQHIKPRLLRDSKGFYRVILNGINDDDVDKQAIADSQAGTVATDDTTPATDTSSTADNTDTAAPATTDSTANDAATDDLADLVNQAHDAMEQSMADTTPTDSSAPAIFGAPADSAPAMDSTVADELQVESNATPASSVDDTPVTPDSVADTAPVSDDEATDDANATIDVPGIGTVSQAKYQAYLRKYAADDPALHPDFFKDDASASAAPAAPETASDDNDDDDDDDDETVTPVGVESDTDYLARVHDAIYNDIATNDLDLKVDKHALDELLLLSEPYQFSFSDVDKSLRDDGLTALANETRRKYNDALRNQHDNNNNKLVDAFNADMRDIVNQIKHQMALDNVGDKRNKTWGALYQELNDEYRQKVDKLQPLINKQQDLLQAEYDRNREDFAKQAADSARLQYDREHKHNLNIRKASVGDEIARSLQMNFINAKNTLLSERALQAQRVLDTKQSEVVDALRHRKHVYAQEEHDQYVQASEGIQTLLENNFQADANKQQALADIAKHDETIHDLRDRNASLIKENTSRVNALNDEIAALKRDHATQISDIKQQCDNDRATAIAEQKRRDAEEYDKLKQLKDQLDEKLSVADAETQKAVAKQRDDDNHVIEHYQQTIDALTSQNKVLSTQNQQLHLNASGDAKRNTRMNIATGLLTGLIGFGLGGSLLFGIGSATHNNNHPTVVTQPQPRQQMPNITVNVPTNRNSNSASSSSSSSSSSSANNSSTNNNNNHH